MYSLVTIGSSEQRRAPSGSVAKLSRRKFLRLVAGAAALPAGSHFACAQVFPSPSQPVRVATGLLSTWQSTAWLGAEAGLFKMREINMVFPAIAVGRPEATAGLFAGIGSSPIPAHSLSRRKF